MPDLNPSFLRNLQVSSVKAGDTKPEAVQHRYKDRARENMFIPYTFIAVFQFIGLRVDCGGQEIEHVI